MPSTVQLKRGIRDFFALDPAAFKANEATTRRIIETAIDQAPAAVRGRPGGNVPTSAEYRLSKATFFDYDVSLEKGEVRSPGTRAAWCPHNTMWRTSHASSHTACAGDGIDLAAYLEVRLCNGVDGYVN